jgi:hypothetical protein
MPLMRKKLRKNKQKKAIKLSPMEQMSLEDNRAALRDMGLKMPRITPKYWGAIKLLSSQGATSVVFYHIIAARKGQAVFYAELEKAGYVWKAGKWQRTKPVKK